MRRRLIWALLFGALFAALLALAGALMQGRGPGLDPVSGAFYGFLLGAGFGAWEGGRRRP